MNIEELAKELDERTLADRKLKGIPEPPEELKKAILRGTVGMLQSLFQYVKKEGDTNTITNDRIVKIKQDDGTVYIKFTPFEKL